jgi:Cu/Ag efflux pump CusA
VPIAVTIGTGPEVKKPLAAVVVAAWSDAEVLPLHSFHQMVQSKWQQFKRPITLIIDIEFAE